MYSVIEKTLAVEIFRPKKRENPYSYKTLSELQKVWDNGHLDKEPSDYTYVMKDFIYRRYLERGGVPATELLEHSDEAGRAYLNELREQFEKEHHTLVLFETGYISRDPHVHVDDMTEHMNTLWSYMDEFIVSPALYQAIKWLCNETTLSTWFCPVERKRSHNHCTYFNETLKYALTTILLLCGSRDAKWFEENIGSAIYDLGLLDELENSKFVPINNLMLMLPEQLRMLAVGKSSNPGTFPEYPTDVWLARFSDDQKTVSGVYSVQLDELGDRLLQPIDEGFPAQPFARDFPRFVTATDDEHFIINFSYALERYIEEVKEQEYRNSLGTLSPDYKISFPDLSEEEILKLGIEELELTVRAFNCLKRDGVNTIADVISKSEQQLIKTRNLGKKSVNEILRRIGDLGLRLREDE
jgi:hypothetical protein